METSLRQHSSSLFYSEKDSLSLTIDAMDVPLGSPMDLDPDTDDVMAWAGVALAWGQALEAELSAFAWLAHPGTSTMGRRDYLALLSRIQKQTLGRLVGDLSARVPEQAVMFESLAAVIERRNFLVHHFFRTPTRQAMLRSSDGQAAMVGELMADVESFRHWAEAIKPVVLMYAVEKGLRVRDLLHRARSLKLETISRESMATEAKTALHLDPHHAEYLVEVLEEAQRKSEGR